MSMKKIPKRSEVLKENTWATEDIFENDAAWEKAFEEAQAYLPKIASFAGKLGTTAFSTTLTIYIPQSQTIGKSLSNTSTSHRESKRHTIRKARST